MDISSQPRRIDEQKEAPGTKEAQESNREGESQTQNAHDKQEVVVLNGRKVISMVTFFFELPPLLQ
jgi:hypothetical protein